MRTCVREEGQVRARRVAHALSIVFASLVRGAVLTGWPILPCTRAARRAVKVDVIKREVKAGSGRKLEVRFCARAEQHVGLVSQGRHSNRTSVRVHQHFGRGSLAKKPGLLPRNG